MTNQALLQRFLKYVKIDTESDPTSNSTPSTSKQWDLAQLLFEELQQIGMTEVTIDDNAYVMATLDSNVNYNVPTIGFVSHFDTTPDFTGAHVNPQIIENYDGLPIPLKGVPNLFLSPEEFDDLLLYKGQTLVTTDGTTLLGADDKAGITEIICAMEHLIKKPSGSNMGKLECVLLQMKRLDAEHINLMSNNLERNGLIPWTAVRLEN